MLWHNHQYTNYIETNQSAIAYNQSMPLYGLDKNIAKDLSVKDKDVYVVIYSFERKYMRPALETIYVFVYKADRHMMERYLSIDYSVHLKYGLTQVQFCSINHV